MRQLFLPHHTPARMLTIEGKNYHYLINVLRLQPGDTCMIVFNNGETFQAYLSRINPKSCIVRLDEKISRPRTDPDITLIQAVPKGKKMDQIIRQATECGVSTIIPVETEFCQIRIKETDFSKKLERWNRIIKEALQQSGSPVITTICEPRGLKEIPRITATAVVGLFFHQSRLELKPLHGYLSPYPEKIFLCIGAEGGFSSEEINFLTEYNYRSVHLGNPVLRTETAVVYALGAVKTLLQEIDSWVLKN